jgi:CheY-like chemotaxis protein
MAEAQKSLSNSFQSNRRPLLQDFCYEIPWANAKIGKLNATPLFAMSTTMFRKRLPPKRILIAEDDLMVATLCAWLLPWTATQSKWMKTEKKHWLCSSLEHDLVITGFKLSNMDGLELAEAITQSTPVILLTDHADAITTGGGPVSNVDVVLRRPCRLKSFRRPLDKFFS